jgi:hypothetical protein
MYFYVFLSAYTFPMSCELRIKKEKSKSRHVFYPVKILVLGMSDGSSRIPFLLLLQICTSFLSN